MVEMMTVAIASFIFGVLFLEIVKRLKKRPKGYIRLRHLESDGGDSSSRRTRQQGESAPVIRSKFDSLFGTGSKKEAKVDLESVEKSFRPDPRPVGQTDSGGLQNRYLDLSYLAENRSPPPETGSLPQSSSYQSFSSPFSATPPSSQSYQPSPIQQTPQNTQTPPNPSLAQNTGYNPMPDSPMSGGAQGPVGNVETPPIKKEEKEHEWKPMGFFDD